MLLTEEQKYKIKRVFERYHLMQAQCKEYREDASSIVKAFDLSGVRSGNAGDPVGGAVAELDGKISEIEGWLSVVDETASYFEGTPRGRMLQLLYFDGVPIRETARRLFVSATTVYEWRTDVFDYAFFCAVRKGLMTWP